MIRRIRNRRAFSLLEVMVAIAILGLALSVILGAQGGLAASNRTSANLGTASALVRCKMSEVEEKLMRQGYQELDQTDYAVSCCDTLDQDGFKCDIKVERVVLPDQQGSDGGAGLVSSLAGGASSSGAPGAPGAAPGGAIAGLLGGGGLDGGASSLQGLGSQVMGSGGADGLMSMAMGIVYPSLKPMLEASIRRVTVAVRWNEGPKERDMTIVQFVTNPMRGNLVGSSLGADGGAAFGTSSSSSGGTTSGGTTGGGTIGGGRPIGGGAH